MTQKIENTNQQQADERQRVMQENIPNLLKEYNQKFIIMFQKKQQDLIHEYEQKMLRLQNSLNQFKQSIQQQQLKKRFIERKEQLQKQREQFISASVHFSIKCDNYKRKLHKTMDQNAELQKQIAYLNDQISGFGRNKNAKLATECNQIIQSNRNRSLYEVEKRQKSVNERKIQIINSLKEKLQQSKNTVISHRESEEANKKKQKSFIDKILNHSLAKRFEFQKIFQASVNEIKKQKKVRVEFDKRKEKILPSLKRYRHHHSNLDILNLNINDTELNDFDKRHIIQDFLSKEQVKKVLYQILLNQRNDYISQEAHRKNI